MTERVVRRSVGILGSSVLALGIAADWPGMAAQGPSTPSASSALDILQVRPDLYMIAGAGGNVAVQTGPDGTVVHGLLTIGEAMIIIEGEWPTLASRAPQPDASSPVVIFVYVENVDAVIERAVAAGARVLLPVKNQFWGDRTGRIIDPSGHVWTISTRVEETSSAERDQRWSSIVKG